MASIYLIRHGQASFGQSNYDQLSELGQQQANVLGAALAQRIEQFDLVVTGSMQRHAQTADGCLAAFTANGKPHLSDDRIQDVGWNEYDHDDILRGLGAEFSSPEAINTFIANQEHPKQAFEKAFNDAMNRWMSGQHDGDYVETWSRYQARIKASLESVVARTRASDPALAAKNVAVFTSGGVISVVAQALLGVPSQNMMHMNWTLMNCAITKLVATKDRLFVASLNEHVHFEQADTRRFITYK